MAETTSDVRRDIELTRERMSSTLAQLERKLNVEQVVRDNPWPALGLAVGAGFLLAGSQADVKAAGATMLATRGASNKLGTALDDIMARLMHEVTTAFHGHVDNLLEQVKGAIGAPPQGNGAGQTRGFADAGGYGAAAGASAGAYGMSAGRGFGGSPSATHGADDASQYGAGQSGQGNPWSAPADGANASHGASQGASQGGLAGSGMPGGTHVPSSAGSQGMSGR